MGLAASQARLLTITARKADCEFQSMSLSHQKIALSRDMERISEEYQDAMNKTKLVYDFYGTGTSNMNLNYALLMTPSVYNDYFPKFLTDNLNRVVLAPEYAKAALAAGIPHEGFDGTPSSAVRNAFIESLCNSGIITAATALNIESVPYNNAIGLGETYSSAQPIIEITYETLIDMIKANCVDTKDYGLYLGGARPGSTYPDTDITWTGGTDKGYSGLYVYNSVSPNGQMYTGSLDGSSMTMDNAFHSASDGSSAAALSLDELLDPNNTTHYIYELDGNTGPTNPLAEAAFAQQDLIGTDYSESFVGWLVDQFSSILGGVTENDLALQYAYDALRDLIYPNEDIQDTIYAEPYHSEVNSHSDNEDKSDFTKHNRFNALEKLNVIGTSTRNSFDSDERNSTTYDALSYIGFTYANCYHDPAGHHQDTVSPIAIDLNTLTRVFFTAFKEYLEGGDSSNYNYEKGKLSEASLYAPSNGDIFKILAPTEVNDGTENLVATFYDAMFNIICTNGWTENANINNAEYMQELLKSGSVFISSMDNDAYYYQSSYSQDTYVREVADTEAIAQAEAKYNAEKARIENKENTIDMKMKNLDTEISSLTTEYDTMKNVISKSIEKSFKRYDA